MIRVPPGTQVRSDDGALHDLVRPGQRALAARGGSGGRGNKHFATPTRQSPHFAERGLPGEEGWLELRAQAARRRRPRRAAERRQVDAALAHDARRAEDRRLPVHDARARARHARGRASASSCIADIPGLIEGASEGAGLGHEFLAHVERTRLLVHVLDLAPLDGSDPERNHATIEAELERHDPRLAALPRVLALSKADLVDARGGAAPPPRAWRERLGGPTRR